jgi:transposase
MDGILPEMRWCDKERVCRELQRCADARQKTWLLIIVNLIHGRGAPMTAMILQVHRSTVYRVAERFRERGLAGLRDGRTQNGPRKLTNKYLARLQDVVSASPENHGWRRPTWTRELLVATLFAKTRISIHVATMSVALKRIGARRGRPKPTVGCPWPEGRKQRCLRNIQRLVENLSSNEVAVYADEVDIHLNPRIGLDWMVRGQQKQVLTPGKNAKRYLAGALDARTHKLIWVEGDHKNGDLFVRLLRKLAGHYRQAKKIHVILDNYNIHSGSRVQLLLAGPDGQQIQMHFLPPYCPDDNSIERVWEDLHANVTRNHHCSTIEDLMANVRQYLVKRNHSGHYLPLAA